MDQAVAERVTVHDIDSAPLWLPAHEDGVVAQSATRPPDAIAGYSISAIVLVALFGSRWKTAITVASLLLAIVSVASIPSLVGAGVGAAFLTAFYQSWTLGLMLIASARVRSLSIGSLCRYYLLGLFTVTMLVYLVTVRLGGLGGSATAMVWFVGPLEELCKALPLVAAIFSGRRLWRHPGLSDLMMIGFAVGAGYSFHQSALWEKSTVSGFQLLTGLVVPSIYQPEGVFAAGHAVWTSLIGFAIGLVVFHRRQALAVVGAAAVALLVVADHMAIVDAEGTLHVVRRLTFNGTLVGLLLVVAFAGAVVLDQRRLAATSQRDHLFPGDRAHSRTPDAAPHDDLTRPLLRTRYRRLRNAVHNTIDASAQQWPPLSQRSMPPIAELARRGRAADLAVGPGTASRGWAPDPSDAGRFRFVSAAGFTDFSAAGSMSVPEATEDGARADDLVRRTRRSDFWQFFGLGLVAVGLYLVVRLLTAGDPQEAVFATSSLVDAPQSPALIRGALGAILAAITIRGRRTVVDAGWNVGPGDDPTPDRPNECEA